MRSFKLFEFQEFADFLKKKKVIYALIIADIIDAIFKKSLIGVIQTNTLYMINIDVVFKLSKKLREYENVFFIQEASRLLFYKNRDYAIKTITKSPFDSLYNLFNIELTKLRRYLNDALTKN